MVMQQDILGTRHLLECALNDAVAAGRDVHEMIHRAHDLLLACFYGDSARKRYIFVTNPFVKFAQISLPRHRRCLSKFSKAFLSKTEFLTVCRREYS